MIERLWNHTVHVYRDPEPVGARDGYGFVDRRPLPLGTQPTGLNCRPDQNWGGSLTDHGPGDQQGAMRRWFLDRSVDVRERDILAVVAGPETGLRVRVESVTKPTHPHRIHHIEVMVKVEKVELGSAA